MARKSDPRKLDEWRDRLRRFKQSNANVTRFCTAEKVSVASFYQWSKKLLGTPQQRQSTAPKKQKPAAFQPVAISVAQAVTIELRSGTRIQVAADVEVVRAVVDQLLQAELARTGEAAC
jgi:hypothetical protein